MSKPLFPTPQDAETAFYEALSRGDLDAMMAVWSDDDDVYCVHPQGPRLTGIAAVRESWRQIFSGGRDLRVQIRGQHAVHGMMFAVSSVLEIITVAGESRPRAPMIATNIYLRTERGWRMVAHHASPTPAETVPAERGSRSKTLH